MSVIKTETIKIRKIVSFKNRERRKRTVLSLAEEAALRFYDNYGVRPVDFRTTEVVTLGTQHRLRPSDVESRFLHVVEDH